MKCSVASVTIPLTATLTATLVKGMTANSTASLAVSAPAAIVTGAAPKRLDRRTRTLMPARRGATIILSAWSANCSKGLGSLGATAHDPAQSAAHASVLATAAAGDATVATASSTPTHRGGEMNLPYKSGLP